MLKITVIETQTENRWVLQGQLVGEWVCELRTCWKKEHRTESPQRCVVDLNDVTFIDKSGERLLRAMSKKGAELVASGIYTKHVLETVKAKGKRSLSMLLVCFFAALVAIVLSFSPSTQVDADLGKMNAQQDAVTRWPFQSRGEHSISAGARSWNGSSRQGVRDRLPVIFGPRPILLSQRTARRRSSYGHQAIYAVSAV
jgi:hypothetical protein